MIKFDTLGMIEVSKNDPTIVLDTEIAQNSFIVKDGTTYWINNELTGHDSYKDDVVFPAGTKLRGFDLKANEGQILVIDAKHIDGTYSTYAVKDQALVVDTNTHKLKAGTGSGVYFVVVEKCTLTDEAVKVRIVVEDKTAA